MNAIFRSLMFVAAVVTSTAWFAAPARADHFDYRYDRLDRLASRLETESRSLASELRRYRGVDANLRAASREVSNIARDAAHIHDLLHDGGSLDHVHRDVVSLQDEIHHVEEHLAPYRHFAVHVQRMDALVHAIDDCLHDLDDHHAVVRPVPVPYRGGAVTIGNGGFSIRLGR